MFFSYSSSIPCSFSPQHTAESLQQRDTKTFFQEKFKTLALPAVTTKTSQQTPKDLKAFYDFLRKTYIHVLLYIHRSHYFSLSTPEMLCVKSSSAKQVWQMMDNDGDDSKKSFLTTQWQKSRVRKFIKQLPPPTTTTTTTTTQRECRRRKAEETETERGGAKRRNKEAAEERTPRKGRETEGERKQGEKTDAKTSVFLTAHT
jgi:hypothetical protein